jgi:hypothetical protein
VVSTYADTGLSKNRCLNWLRSRSRRAVEASNLLPNHVTFWVGEEREGKAKVRNLRRRNRGRGAEILRSSGFGAWWGHGPSGQGDVPRAIVSFDAPCVNPHRRSERTWWGGGAPWLSTSSTLSSRRSSTLSATALADALSSGLERRTDSSEEQHADDTPLEAVAAADDTLSPCCRVGPGISGLAPSDWDRQCA